MISSIVSRLVILVFGTLYPAYASYKAVRTKNVKEYVKWMMYWIVFALFTCAETFTDVFFSFWFPFYYEIKVILVLWLLSPATKGSSILYRKFVHPMLTKREQEIDDYISRAKEQGYHTVLSLGTKGVNYATSVIMQTAIKNLNMVSAMASTSLVAIDEPVIPVEREEAHKQHKRHHDETDYAFHEEMFSDDDNEALMVVPTPPVKKAPRPKKANAKKATAIRKTRSNIENHNIKENEDLYLSDLN